jgi:hypothetical protein
LVAHVESLHRENAALRAKVAELGVYRDAHQCKNIHPDEFPCEVELSARRALGKKEGGT